MWGKHPRTQILGEICALSFWAQLEINYKLPTKRPSDICDPSCLCFCIFKTERFAFEFVETAWFFANKRASEKGKTFPEKVLWTFSVAALIWSVLESSPSHIQRWVRRRNPTAWGESDSIWNDRLGKNIFIFQIFGNSSISKAIRSLPSGRIQTSDPPLDAPGADSPGAFFLNCRLSDRLSKMWPKNVTLLHPHSVHQQQKHKSLVR